MSPSALERVVADVEHAARDARAAGDREVPRQLQVAARDAGAAQGLEDALHARAPRLERRRRSCTCRRGTRRTRATAASGAAAARRRDGGRRRRSDGPRRSWSPVARSATALPGADSSGRARPRAASACPLRVSMTTIGESASSERPMSVIGGRVRQREIGGRHPEEQRRARAEAVGAIQLGGLERDARRRSSAAPPA